MHACTPVLCSALRYTIKITACPPTSARQVVPPLSLTLEQLAGYGGSDPSKPLLLSVCGTILDVTAGA